MKCVPPGSRDNPPSDEGDAGPGGSCVPLGPLLALTIGALVAAHFVVLGLGSGLDVSTSGALSWLDLFQERSLGTWVNAAILGAAAVAAASLAGSSAGARARIPRGWKALAVLLALASIDEVAGIHESLVEIGRSAADMPRFLYYAAWVPVVLPLIAGFIAWQWRFFALLPRRLAVRLGAAAGVYIAAATGFELIESEIFARRGGQDWTGLLQVLVGMEEGLEMGAAAVMLLALLAHLAVQAPHWRLSVGLVQTGARREHADRIVVSMVRRGGPGDSGEHGRRGGRTPRFDRTSD